MRWQKLSGGQATLDGSCGQTFEQVKHARGMEADAIKEEVLGTLTEASN